MSGAGEFSGYWRGVDGLDIDPVAQTIGGANLLSTFSAYAALTTDETIVATAPTAPFTFPAGQPALLLPLAFDLGAGPVEIAMSFCGALQANAAPETDPFLWLQLWIDGVWQDTGDAIIAWDSSGATTPLTTFTAEASTIYRFVATGAHLLELRWGLLGAVPDVVAVCFGAPGGGNHAQLKVQRIA